MKKATEEQAIGAVEIVTKRVRLTFTEEVLGSNSPDAEIQRNYIASKAPDAQTLEDEVAAASAEEVADSKMTVFFYINPETGLPFTKDELEAPHYPGIAVMKSHQMRGYIMDTAGKMRTQAGTLTNKIKAYKKLIDGAVKVEPMWIPYVSGGKYLTRADMGRCERPLRAETMQGPRVALAASESIPAGASVEIWINMRPQLTGPDIWDLVQEWLNFGEDNGFGQWHSSGRGRFVWELLDDDGNVVGGNKAAWEKKEKPWQVGLNPAMAAAVMAMGREG